MTRIRLVLGGARSGKSAFAERVARETGLERHYLATSRIYDDAHAARIELHRQARDLLNWMASRPLDDAPFNVGFHWAEWKAYIATHDQAVDLVGPGAMSITGEFIKKHSVSQPGTAAIGHGHPPQRWRVLPHPPWQQTGE